MSMTSLKRLQLFHGKLELGCPYVNMIPYSGIPKLRMDTYGRKGK